MNKYIIETKNLTKKYGSQKSVADLNIHVQKRKDLWSAWEKRSRKNNNYENVARTHKTNVR